MTYDLTYDVTYDVTYDITYDVTYDVTYVKFRWQFQLVVLVGSFGWQFWLAVLVGSFGLQFQLVVLVGSFTPRARPEEGFSRYSWLRLLGPKAAGRFKGFGLRLGLFSPSARQGLAKGI